MKNVIDRLEKQAVSKVSVILIRQLAEKYPPIGMMRAWDSSLTLRMTLYILTFETALHSLRLFYFLTRPSLLGSL
jgi:hypothetical protein